MKNKIDTVIIAIFIIFIFLAFFPKITGLSLNSSPLVFYGLLLSVIAISLRVLIVSTIKKNILLTIIITPILVCVIVILLFSVLSLINSTFNLRLKWF